MEVLKGCYPREPFDLRLALLRLIKKLHWVLGLTALGVILFGGGYYVKNVLLQPEKKYCAESVYKVEYADPDWSANGTYINYMTWTTWVNTKEIKDLVKDCLGDRFEDRDMTITAEVDSDLRVPSTQVTSASPQYSLLYAKALEQVMVQEFPRLNAADVSAVRVIDPALEAKEIHPDVRPVRALILSGVLSLFCILVVFFLKEWGEDSIWLPATLYRRYGLRTPDTLLDQGLEADIGFFFDGQEKIAVCPVEDGKIGEEAARFLREKVKDKNWIPFPAVFEDRKVCEKLKETDGVLLLVKAGHHSGKKLEYALQILEQHECKVACAMLWGADERLVRNYYRFGGDKRS